jgi:hypothetical protein
MIMICDTVTYKRQGERLDFVVSMLYDLFVFVQKEERGVVEEFV